VLLRTFADGSSRVAKNGHRSPHEKRES
jgi:hypothetical protein